MNNVNNGNNVNNTNTTIKKSKAIEIYAETCSVTGACSGVGIARSTWYTWLKEDEDFAEEVNKAREHVANVLEQEAVKRALAKSDLLIIFLLKGLKPDVYHDRVSSEITHNNKVSDPGRVKIDDKTLDKLIAAAEDLRKARKQNKPNNPSIPIHDDTYLESVN